MSLAGAALGSVGATLVGNLLLLLAGVLTARLLGPVGKGAYVFAVLIPHLAVNFLIFGLGGANTYFIAMKRQSAEVALGTTLALLLPFTTLCVVGFQLFLRSGHWLSESGQLLALTAWSVPPAVGYSLIRHTVLGLQQYRYFNLLNAFDKGLVLTLLAAGSLVRGDKVRLFCALFALSSGLSFLVALGIVLTILGWRLRMEVGYARQALAYGLRGHVGWVAELLNYRLDMLLVHALAGALSLGLYSVAVSLAETLWFIPGCISIVLMAEYARRKGDSSVTTALICRLIILMTLLGALCLSLVGGALLRFLFGSQFQASFLPLLLLLPGVTALSVVKILNADFAGRGRPGLGSSIAFLSLLVTIVADVTLIPAYGARGAALASTLAYTVSTGFGIWLYTRLTGMRPSNLLVLQRGDISSLLGALRRLGQGSVSLSAPASQDAL
ncbi:MAG: polysaccharide biosynthesis C-terminal domain-containing protein [Chloroflexi bacterium]|nr:polysaccharide biosynthesis C-terminal domain-containing protein [Chloroflexota bacterium]